MDHIETKILNSYTIQEAAQNMVFAARLTQQGHSIQNMDDLMALYQKSFTDKTVDRIASLPHPTVQKFTVITVAIVGASRRFLAQITRHQNEVKFMSASLQYSNYSEKAAFAIPYEFDPVLFSPKLTGPFCQRGGCEEGSMSCGIPIPTGWTPLEILRADYPRLIEGRVAVYEN